MKNTTVNLAMLIACGLLLNGCENSHYSAASCNINENNTQPESFDCTTPQGAIIASADPAPAEKIDVSQGLIGRVFDDTYWVNAQVCFDTNQNATCDLALETTVLTDEQGQYVFTNNATYAGLHNGSPLIAILNNQLMSASPAANTDIPSTSNISPFSSIVVNEMLFNKASFQDTELAIKAIADKEFILASPSLLTGKDYLSFSDIADSDIPNTAQDINNFISSFKKIQNSFNQLETPVENYSVIAAMFNAMIENKSFDINVDTEIDQSDIDALYILNRAVNTQLSNQLITWNLDYEDEKSRKLTTQDNLAIVGSKWHNRLTLLDTSTTEPSWVSSTVFAHVKGGKDAIDAFSGATEQLLQDIDISPDNRNVFVTIKKAKKNSNDIGVGIYRADIFSPQYIEETEFASSTENTSDYYAYPNINNTALSGDGKVLALASEKRKIALLNADTLAEQNIIELDSKVRSIALNEQGDHIYAGLSRSSRTGIISINTATKEETAYIISENYPTDLQYIGSNLLAASFYQEPMLSIFDITDSSNIITLKHIIASDTITSFSLSDNAKFAAIAMQNGKFELFELTPSIRLIKKFDSKNNAHINDISFTSDNRLLVSTDNSIQVLTMTIDDQL